MSQILAVEVFCKIYEERSDYYFEINDTTKERAKEFLIDHCKKHREIMNFDASDKYIEQEVTSIEFSDNLTFYSRLEELRLFISGEVEDLL